MKNSKEYVEIRKLHKEDYLCEVGSEIQDNIEVRSISSASRNERNDRKLDTSNLMEKILHRDNMNEAFKKVKKNKGSCGVDGMTVDELLEYLKQNSKQLLKDILEESYTPKPVLRVEIDKPEGGKRKLGIPTVVDRVIQQAIAQVLTPIYEEKFSETSYGIRQGRSQHQAIEKCKEYINEGYKWVVDIDASQMFGIPIEKITKGHPDYELRQKGKVAELALGYQGAAGALIAMGALKMGLSEDELPEIVKRWRASNKRIVDLWYSIENSVLEVMRTGQAIGIKGLFLTREVDFNTNQHFFTITLPSKRKLFYAQPFLQNNELGRHALHYRGINQETKKWENIPTYGGKIVENIVQAIARDCLAVSLQRLDAAGFQTVMHVHDEVILDVPVEFADIKTVTDIMGLPIEWAPGLLLRAEGYEAEYYRKE